MKKLMLMVAIMAMLVGCAQYKQPAPTVKNYTGGQYNDEGQNPNYPYQSPYGPSGGDGAASL